jgi:hypothetical protein
VKDWRCLHFVGSMIDLSRLVAKVLASLNSSSYVFLQTELLKSPSSEISIQNPDDAPSFE